MENPRAEKVAVVEEVRARLDGAQAALLTEYRGMDVAATSALRRALRDAGGEYKIYKNTLVRFAARDLGLDLEHLLTGTTAIAFVSGDPVQVAKALRDFARGNPALVVKGGLLGTKVLDADEVRGLADVEPREVILGRLAGAIAAPMQQFAGLLLALPRNLAYGLQALIDRRGGAPSADAEAQPGDADPAADDDAIADTQPAAILPDDAPAPAPSADAEAQPGDAVPTPSADADDDAITDTQPAAVLPDDGEAPVTEPVAADPAPGDITDTQPAAVLPDPTDPPAVAPIATDPADPAT